MEILKQTKNSLLHREEVVITLEQTVTPSKQEVTKMLSEKLKKPEENIVIEKVGSKFGSQTFTISAKVYDDVKSKDKYETVPKKVRKKQAEEAKKKADEEKIAKAEAEKAAEESTTEEKPTEEKPTETSDAPVDEPKAEVKQEDAQPDKEPTESKMEKQE